MSCIASRLKQADENYSEDDDYGDEGFENEESESSMSSPATALVLPHTSVPACEIPSKLCIPAGQLRSNDHYGEAAHERTRQPLLPSSLSPNDKQPLVVSSHKRRADRVLGALSGQDRKPHVPPRRGKRRKRPLATRKVEEKRVKKVDIAKELLKAKLVLRQKEKVGYLCSVA